MTVLSRRIVLGGALALPARALAIPRRHRVLHDAIGRILAEAGVPGAGLAMVRRERIVAFGVGLADVAARRSATERTAFHIASVSKLVTTTALLRMADAGRLALDAPIAPLLDFPVANPRHPGAALTLRHLLQHVSSISDANYGPQFFSSGASAIPLDALLRGYLAPGGRWYAAERSYRAEPPGTHWAYSNIGIALAGHLAERAGTPLDIFSRRELFAPLGMADSVWRAADLAPARRAIGYARSAAGPAPLPPVSYPDWPAGMMRSSARDLARFLRGFLVPARAVLTAPTFATMLRVDEFPGFTATLNGQALGWRRSLIGGRPLLGHTGSDPGVTSGVWMDRMRGTGAVVLMNLTIDDRTRAARARIAELLLAAAEALD